MIAIAGYLNYSGRIFGKEDTKETSGTLANQELLDISDEGVATAGDIKSQDQEASDGEVEGTPGEAVLTSGVVAEAKVTREQVRAKNKETLQAIIDNEKISEEQKKDAIAQMVRVTELAEKEAAVETLLASKGFTDTVVSLTDDAADIVVGKTELTDANLAQIEDIVVRKTEIPAANIVITPIHTEKTEEK